MKQHPDGYWVLEAGDRVRQQVSKHTYIEVRPAGVMIHVRTHDGGTVVRPRMGNEDEIGIAPPFGEAD